jgi:tRNA dimethylallyltransferase
MSRNRFIVITGPTASGKTKISVLVAKALGSEVISADSMQIYKGLDIGTAKPAPEEMMGVKHHMVDIIAPDCDYSVAEFQKEAFSIIDELNRKGIVPVISGGTGLYINSLVYKLDFAKTDKNNLLRQKYSEVADDKSTAYLYNILKEKDPSYANIISENDKRRIIRRLEVIETGGDIDYDFRKYNEKYEFLIVGLRVPRETLYKRIEERSDKMISEGLVEETESIYTKYGNVNALKAIGYKEMIPYINGEYELQEAVRLIKRNTRRYAKRQMTWFGRDERMKWFDICAYSCIEDTVNDIIIYIKRKGF